MSAIAGSYRRIGDRCGGAQCFTAIAISSTATAAAISTKGSRASSQSVLGVAAAASPRAPRAHSKPLVPVANVSSQGGSCIATERSVAAASSDRYAAPPRAGNSRLPQRSRHPCSLTGAMNAEEGGSRRFSRRGARNSSACAPRASTLPARVPGRRAARRGREPPRRSRARRGDRDPASRRRRIAAAARPAAPRSSTSSTAPVASRSTRA